MFELPPGWREDGWHRHQGMVSTITDEGLPGYVRRILDNPAECLASMDADDRRDFMLLLGVSARYDSKPQMAVTS